MSTRSAARFEGSVVWNVPFFIVNAIPGLHLWVPKRRLSKHQAFSRASSITVPTNVHYTIPSSPFSEAITTIPTISLSAVLTLPILFVQPTPIPFLISTAPQATCTLRSGFYRFQAIGIGYILMNLPPKLAFPFGPYHN